MVCPYSVGHSGVTGANFDLTACSGLWLLASVQEDCVNLTAVLILDTSGTKDNFRISQVAQTLMDQRGKHYA